MGRVRNVVWLLLSCDFCVSSHTCPILSSRFTAGQVHNWKKKSHSQVFFFVVNGFARKKVKE